MSKKKFDTDGIHLLVNRLIESVKNDMIKDYKKARKKGILNPILKLDNYIDPIFFIFLCNILSASGSEIKNVEFLINDFTRRVYKEAKEKEKTHGNNRKENKNVRCIGKAA